jgi:hypothetical protein
MFFDIFIVPAVNEYERSFTGIRPHPLTVNSLQIIVTELIWEHLSDIRSRNALLWTYQAIEIPPGTADDRVLTLPPQLTLQTLRFLISHLHACCQELGDSHNLHASLPLQDNFTPESLISRHQNV